MKPQHIGHAFWIGLMLFSAANAQTQLPSFEATSLTGNVVTEQRLIGQPAVLIVTPSKAAAGETRQWARALRKNIDPHKVMVRDILVIDLPFFISERDAVGRAKEKIPKRYHDQTWLLAESSLEQALHIPRSSEEATVLVLNPEGKVIARVSGKPTPQRINEIENSVAHLTQ